MTDEEMEERFKSMNLYSLLKWKKKINRIMSDKRIKSTTERLERLKLEREYNS